ncbi:hypothetical protein HMPREF9457_00426 [Dorea formicigenerans 4_6_53AFAA]|nr:hypothetical protein HMPREF9457_00426 [Dorea formicigenerans 4_6_53AFAA]
MTGYDRENTNLNYEDIINLPHPVSKRHKPMPVEDRAAQFAPFAALTGHQAAIEEVARVTDMRMELDEEMKEQLNVKLQKNCVGAGAENPTCILCSGWKKKWWQL